MEMQHLSPLLLLFCGRIVDMEEQGELNENFSELTGRGEELNSLKCKCVESGLG